MSTRRGQALVLMSLTGLLLVLMVMLLVSFGKRIHQKIESQNLADAAAYSQAVATARSFNELGVLNRTQVAHMVNIATINSVISLSTRKAGTEQEVGRSTWRMMLSQTRSRIRLLQLQGFTPSTSRLLCGYLKIEAGLSALSEHCPSICCWGDGPSTAATFGALDALAAEQARQRYLASLAVYAQMQAAMVGPLPVAPEPDFSLLGAKVKDQQLTRRVLYASLAGTRGVDSPAGASVSSRELNTALHWREQQGEVQLACPTCDTWDWRTAHLMIMLGTRDALAYDHESWISQIGPDIANAANSLSHRCVPGTTFGVSSASSGGGSAYFAADFEQGPTMPGGRFLSDDQMTLSLTVAGGDPVGSGSCSAVTSAPVQPADVYLGASMSPLSLHSVGGPTSGAAEGDRHMLFPTLLDGSMYPFFFDLSPDRIKDVADLYGQPKGYALVRREYSAPQPTFPAMSFAFGGYGRFDSRGALMKSGDDISASYALSAGLTYFHRWGHWKEPPNLFSPYWRATLVSPVVDARGAGDVAEVLDTLAGSDQRASMAAELARELTNVGYRGF